jgi:hypothetical protein
VSVTDGDERLGSGRIRICLKCFEEVNGVRVFDE